MTPQLLNLSNIGSKNRIFSCFWLFGLINNVLYVVILNAAIDLVGPLAPKATVLLADVLPAFFIKLTAPFFIHLIPYNIRIYILIILSVGGMLIIAFSTSTGPKIFGIVLASTSSGLGELTFLQLTHFFGEWSLPAFSSGTGGAGLVGSSMYLLFTTVIRLSIRTSLLLFTSLPIIFYFLYFHLLPQLDQIQNMYHHREDLTNDHSEVGLLAEENNESVNEIEEVKHGITFELILENINTTLHRLKPLVIPYMVPLLLVYAAEYTINQGISPTLLFPIEEMPFKKFRDVYVTYGTLYQLGVFISRSSSSFFRIKYLYAPAILQAINVVICIFQSIYMIIPNIYLVMVLVFYEGLLGGASYVNTFLQISENSPLEDREFRMGAVGISDSSGIVIAAIISMWLEKSLCRYQIRDGRPWCEME